MVFFNSGRLLPDILVNHLTGMLKGLPLILDKVVEYKSTDDLLVRPLKEHELVESYRETLIIHLAVADISASDFERRDIIRKIKFRRAFALCN